MKLTETSQGLNLVYSLSGRAGAIRALYADEIQAGWSQYLAEYQFPVAWIDENVNINGLAAIKSVVGTIPSLRIASIKPEKSLAMAESMWEEMLASRCDLAIAVGGGTLCDIVGWSASAFRRGIDHILIPTTLLAMIDAAIGGKTGIDAYGAKNVVGAIHPAKWTFASLRFLETLPSEEIRSALAEAIKVAILYDSSLLHDLYHVLPQVDLTQPLDVRTIARIAALKASLVEEEGRQRDGLLYGHNVGHAIEALPHTKIRHGEAVAIGMSLEGWMAVEDGVLDVAIWKLQQEMLQVLHLPRSLPHNIQAGDVVNAMRRYRLYHQGEFLFVVPSGQGTRYFKNGDGYLRISEDDMLARLSAAVSSANMNS